MPNLIQRNVFSINQLNFRRQPTRSLKTNPSLSAPISKKDLICQIAGCHLRTNSKTLGVKYFSYLITILALVLTSCDSNRKEKDEALEDLTENHENFVGQLSDSLSDGGILVEEGQIEEYNANIEKAAHKMEGKAGEAILALAPIRTRDANIVAEINKRANEISTLISWKDAIEQKDFETRRQALRDFAKFNQTVIDDYAGRSKEITKILDSIDYTGKEREALESGAQLQLKQTFPYIKIIRTCDIDFANTCVGMLDILENAGDSVSWDTEDQIPAFEQDLHLEKWNQSATTIQEIGQKQIQAQQDLVQAVQHP